MGIFSKNKASDDKSDANKKPEETSNSDVKSDDVNLSDVDFTTEEDVTSSEEQSEETTTTDTNELKAKAEAEALKAHKAKNPLVFENDGCVYRFKKTTPKTLRFGGVPRSLKDLINDKAAMLELISGRNNFVERIK